MKARDRRNIALLIAALVLAGIGLTYSDDTPHLEAGDRIELIRALDIPELESHVTIQQGQLIPKRDMRPYQSSCVIETRDLGPFTIEPQVFTIRSVEYLEEMESDTAAVVRYYNEIRLSGTQLDLLMSCQILDDTMQYHSFSIDEIRRITAGYFLIAD